MLVTAPIMCVGGIFMAIHQDAGLSWLLLVSVPVLALANYWIMSHLLPIFRSMQRLIDGINRVMREQLVRHPGDPRVRPGTVRTQPLRRGQHARCRTPRWPPAAGRR